MRGSPLLTINYLKLNKMRNQEIRNAIEKLEHEGIYIPDYIDLEYISNYEDMQTVDDLINVIERYINETEITYYSTAIKFLAEEDASLKSSLDLAHEMGCGLHNVDSEFLATLLLQDLLTNELHEIL